MLIVFCNHLYIHGSVFFVRVQIPLIPIRGRSYEAASFSNFGGVGIFSRGVMMLLRQKACHCFELVPVYTDHHTQAKNWQTQMRNGEITIQRKRVIFVR